MGLQGDVTKPGTTDLQFRETERRIRLPRDPWKYEGRDLTDDQLRQVQRDREQKAIDLALRSGTAAKVLG